MKRDSCNGCFFFYKPYCHKCVDFDKYEPKNKPENKQGTKHDSGKPRYELLPPDALEALVKVYTFGADKYGDGNWEKGFKWSRIFGAIMRHLWAFKSGKDIDEESGLPHLTHAAWGCMTLLAFYLRKDGEDDR